MNITTKLVKVFVRLLLSFLDFADYFMARLNSSEVV